MAGERGPVSKPGDVWQVGSHRIACGDAADHGVVAALMGGERASLCFTSPPYGNKRNYTTGGIADWDAMMHSVFGAVQTALRDNAQILVNLGLVHRDNEWHSYWDGWIAWMRTQGWRRFAWYVWDQGPGLPGDWVGRLAPSFEFIFHFNRKRRKPNKIVPCKCAGLIANPGSCLRDKNGVLKGYNHVGRQIQSHRIPNAVIRINRNRKRIGRGIDHPAVFPIELPEFVIEAYTDVGDIVLDPFGGSGTTMLAAERAGRVCRSVEIAPEYVDVSIKRWLHKHPDIPAILASTGQTFEEVKSAREAFYGG